MLPKIFTISILAIVSFMLFAGFTQNQKVSMYCFYALGVIVSINFALMIRDLIDKSSK
jgi:Fe2+ transport system protein B